MKKDTIIRFLITVSRIFVGLVLIFSGFVKGVDPMGSAYKFGDYFIAFRLGFLEPTSIALSFLLSAAEFLIGISLLFRFWFRAGAWAVSIFMAFFTVLTLILALTNPVTDCGCFGDAILMTNWQTFIKNLVLLPFVAVIFIFHADLPEPWRAGFSGVGLGVFALLFLMIQINAYRHLPQFDFRPYSVGTFIPDKMSIPEGMPQDQYQTILFYEKDGEIREFSEDNFPWEDSSWKFVDTEHKLISKGYEPPIHDFTIVDEYGIDHVPAILSDEGYTFLLVSTHIEKAEEEALAMADELASWCQASGYAFYCLSSSLEEDISRVLTENSLGFGIYTTDEITLKTIVRSNPGLLLLKDGSILAKWHHNDFPAPDEMEGELLAFAIEEMRRIAENKSLAMFITLFLLLSSIIILQPFGRKN
jgi:hypothetical protein